MRARIPDHIRQEVIEASALRRTLQSKVLARKHGVSTSLIAKIWNEYLRNKTEST